MNPSESVTMTQKKISIIVPCYNVEKYLPRCLDSLVEQSLEDIEIICINDGSTDTSIDIIQDYKKRFPELIKVIDKQNKGVWGARLDGITLAESEYIGFLDGDDCAHPDFCRKLYEAALATEADIVTCGFRRIEFEDNRVLNVEMTEMRTSFTTAEEPARLLELNGAPWNKLFKAAVFENLYDFKNPPQTFEDMMLLLLVFPKITKAAFVAEPLVDYSVREGSLMTTAIDKDKIDSVYQAMLEVRDYYSGHADSSLRFVLDAEAFLHLGISLMFSISNSKTQSLTQALKANRTYLTRYFPSWKSNAIISAHNAKLYGGALRKVYWARLIYLTRLMKPALSAYRFMIEKLGKDIKW